MAKVVTGERVIDPREFDQAPVVEPTLICIEEVVLKGQERRRLVLQEPGLEAAGPA